MDDLLIETVAWIGGVAISAFVVDRSALWLIVRGVSGRALRRHRTRAGGGNRLVIHGVNTADNCRTPMSIADAVICYCVYDVSSGPVSIDAVVPPGRCWSLSCYGTDTSCFFTRNHRSPEAAAGHVRLRLCGQRSDKSADADIIVQTADSAGIVLIRTLLNDPADLQEREEVMHLLRQTIVEPCLSCVE